MVEGECSTSSSSYIPKPRKAPIVTSKQITTYNQYLLNRCKLGLYEPTLEYGVIATMDEVWFHIHQRIPLEPLRILDPEASGLYNKLMKMIDGFQQELQKRPEFVEECYMGLTTEQRDEIGVYVKAASSVLLGLKKRYHQLEQMVATF